jgi:uncharacterized damage-inducible protein DinB
VDADKGRGYDPVVSFAVPETFYDGWENHERLLLAAVRNLTPEQLALRTTPDMWSVWQIAGHMAGARAYWLHDMLGEGDSSVRDMFRVTSTTVPDLPLESAGWEDDENHPRGAAEIVVGLERSWALLGECLQRWTPDELAVEVPPPSSTRGRASTRGWVIWHLMEHDLHHGGEISLILGSNGLQGLDL